MIPSLPSLLVIHYGFGLYLGVFFFLCTYFYFQLERMRKSYECTSNPTLDNSQTQNKIKPSWEGGRGLVLIFQRRLSSRKTRGGTRESQNRSHEAGSSRDGWKRQSSNKLEYEFIVKKETLHVFHFILLFNSSTLLLEYNKNISEKILMSIIHHMFVKEKKKPHHFK